MYSTLMLDWMCDFVLILARKTYDREFLLKFKFWNIRPDFEESSMCILTEPHFIAGERYGFSDNFYCFPSTMCVKLCFSKLWLCMLLDCNYK